MVVVHTKRSLRAILFRFKGPISEVTIVKKALNTMEAGGEVPPRVLAKIKTFAKIRMNWH